MSKPRNFLDDGPSEYEDIPGIIAASEEKLIREDERQRCIAAMCPEYCGGRDTNYLPPTKKGDWWMHPHKDKRLDGEGNLVYWRRMCGAGPLHDLATKEGQG